VNRTEPAILRALVRGSAERLAPVAAAVNYGTSLPGWRLRVLDGSHLPASEKRLAPLREHRGAALSGQALVVYDPDSGLVTDLVAGEDAHQSERALVGPLLDSAQPGQLWIGDRHFCTRAVMQGWDEAQAGFIVREHGRHPRLARQGEWRGCGRAETGQVREQAIEVAGAPAPWRRIELALDTPTEAGERAIRLWSNLPEEIGAGQIAALYRTRWRVERSRSPDIEGMFQQLESVLNSEIRSLGHPRAALLGFAVAVLAHNILALLQRCVEQAHQDQKPPPEVSTYHLALHIRGGYEGMLIALPPEQWRSSNSDPTALADRLLQLARNIDPCQVATSKRGPKVAKPKGYVDGAIARAQVSTARVLAQAQAATP
jgi:IS4 transposase